MCPDWTPQWGLSFAYDGFGNRLSQTVTKGTAPSNSVLVDGTTNRISSAGFVYDLNGNMTNMPTNTATLTYDASNRMTQYSGTNISEAYAYAPDNKRIWRSNTMRGCEVPNTPGQSQPTPTQGDAIIFYSAHGLKLGVYCLKEQAGTRFQIASEQNLYFGGRFVARVGLLRNVVSIGTDRLHSTQSQGGHFPYGEFKSGGATAQDKEEFGTYTRDRSGLDYADQRIYNPSPGRFTSKDPLDNSGTLISPNTLNKFAYANSDPVNLFDPSGLDAEGGSEYVWCPLVNQYIPQELCSFLRNSNEFNAFIGGTDFAQNYREAQRIYNEGLTVLQNVRNGCIAAAKKIQSDALAKLPKAPEFEGPGRAFWIGITSFGISNAVRMWGATIGASAEALPSIMKPSQAEADFIVRETKGALLWGAAILALGQGVTEVYKTMWVKDPDTLAKWQRDNNMELNELYGLALAINQEYFSSESICNSQFNRSSSALRGTLGIR